jgi:hypothetical protein
LEKLPVDLRKAHQQLPDLEMVASHQADLGNQVAADIFGDGLLVDLAGEVVTALGRVLVERALEEQREGVLDLAEELFLAEKEEGALARFHSMRIYTHTMTPKIFANSKKGLKKIRKSL